MVSLENKLILDEFSKLYFSHDLGDLKFPELNKKYNTEPNTNETPTYQKPQLCSISHEYYTHRSFYSEIKRKTLTSTQIACLKDRGVRYTVRAGTNSLQGYKTQSSRSS